VSWFDWTLLDRHADIHRFVRVLNAFRQERKAAAADDLPLMELLRRSRIEWHGVHVGEPDWNEDSHSIAFTMRTPHARFMLHAILNAYWEPMTFELPAPDGGQWRRCIDTALPSPADIQLVEDAPLVTACTYRVESRSVVVFSAPLAT
jgi:isoamylase